MSMNNFFDINYEKNMQMLSSAVEYCAMDYTHEDLIKELSGDNELKKQFCIIQINEINNQYEADMLVYNLTDKPGPIRETASFKILELIKQNNFKHFFQKKSILDIFIKAIVDINPSVSRNIIEILPFVDDSGYLYSKIIGEILKTQIAIKDIPDNKSYLLNKKNFNLYWNLEAITSISGKITADDTLFNILKNTAVSKDYTIREKTAKAAFYLSKKNDIFIQILNLLANDTNMYVRRYSML